MIPQLSQPVFQPLAPLLAVGLFSLPLPLSAQQIVAGNERAASSAEAERRVMEATLAEILALVGEDSERGRLFLTAQNEWVQYVKEQAKADADGVSGEARYPQAYFQTMRELTRYRTRALEGCLSRLQAEQVGARGLASGESRLADQGDNNSVRDWKKEVGDEESAEAMIFYQAEVENVPGILAGQWRGEELWRGVFLADRGDAMVFYGGKMERGGVVFEAWQEGSRVGRGFVREEDGDLRGRFFDERRRESPVILRRLEPSNPVAHEVALTPYTGLLGTEELAVALEWHHTRFVRGEAAGRRVQGFNYSQGKLYLAEFAGEGEGPIVALWSLEKDAGASGTRWTGTRKAIGGPVGKVDFGR
ncbi:DUF1311 domain-containing protein [Roseibacillus ishigakijimensis]|uniref:DUF1311 domain-containing protein n=1 Tax=Roseibacillus ishigakijimensis TaxID=454146 RepID=A0A934RR94_9BACT|nr:DUF1311 domain-containing protein [Roseibacillus ishigakijimensis]MBK1832800.1 DUF1311 domain-containing protein [Roseibacillus ishigakijimensis]